MRNWPILVGVASPGCSSWLVGWLVCWFVGWLVCWLVGWLVCWLVWWLVGLLVCWLVGLLVGTLTVGWFVGSGLVGWFVDWLVCWFFVVFLGLYDNEALFKKNETTKNGMRVQEMQEITSPLTRTRNTTQHPKIYIQNPATRPTC